GGTNGMRILSEETDPELVKFNFDVFWVHHAGNDPAAFIRAHANRAGYFHFKDGKKNPDGSPVFLELGRGIVDLESAMAAAREVGAEWIVAEQDKTELPHLESSPSAVNICGVVSEFNPQPADFRREAGRWAKAH